MASGYIATVKREIVAFGRELEGQESGAGALGTYSRSRGRNNRMRATRVGDQIEKMIHFAVATVVFAAGAGCGTEVLISTGADGGSDGGGGQEDSGDVIGDGGRAGNDASSRPDGGANDASCIRPDGSCSLCNGAWYCASSGSPTCPAGVEAGASCVNPFNGPVGSGCVVCVGRKEYRYSCQLNQLLMTIGVCSDSD
jgi:hypothetical protein